MMQSEFEALAGMEVTPADYNNIIEPMYMATNLTKEEFVRTVNLDRFRIQGVSKPEWYRAQAMDKVNKDIEEINGRESYLTERKEFHEYLGNDDEVKHYKKLLRNVRRELRAKKEIVRLLNA